MTFEITNGPYGWCPVQADGLIDGSTWYFRARGASWHLEIGGISGRLDDEPTKPVAFETPTGPITFNVLDFDKIEEKIPIWWHEEDWGTWPDAGYMSDSEAMACIDKAIALYRANNPSVMHPSDPEWHSYVWKTWSASMVGTHIAAKELGLTRKDMLAAAKEAEIALPWFEEARLKWGSDEDGA